MGTITLHGFSNLLTGRPHSKRVLVAKWLTEWFNVQSTLRSPFALLAAALISTGLAAPYASAQSSIATASTSSTASTGGSYASCLLEVPYNVTIGSYDNSYGYGVSATFPNGTEILFPYPNCMRPVHPDMYQVILDIGNNASFIAAENGSLYSWGGFPSYEELINNTYNISPPDICRSGSVTTPQGTECYSQNYLWFFLYNGRMLQGCDGPYADFNGWLDVHVAINSTDGVDTSHIEVEQLGAFDGIFLCTATTSDSLSQSGTTTHTSTITRTVTVTLHAGQSPIILAILAVLAIVSGVVFVATFARVHAKGGPKSSTRMAQSASSAPAEARWTLVHGARLFQIHL